MFLCFSFVVVYLPFHVQIIFVRKKGLWAEFGHGRESRGEAR